MIFHKVHYGMQTTVNSTTMIFRTTKILPCRRFLILSHMDSMFYQLVNTMILICCDGYDRYAQQAFHLIDVHRATIALHLVHHVQGKHHRYA